MTCAGNEEMLYERAGNGAITAAAGLSVKVVKPDHWLGAVLELLQPEPEDEDDEPSPKTQALPQLLQNFPCAPKGY